MKKRANRRSAEFSSYALELRFERQQHVRSFVIAKSAVFHSARSHLYHLHDPSVCIPTGYARWLARRRVRRKLRNVIIFHERRESDVGAHRGERKLGRRCAIAFNKTRAGQRASTSATVWRNFKTLERKNRRNFTKI